MTTTLDAEQIANHFLDIPFATRTGCNWGTSLDNTVFDVSPTVYINGFLTHVDFDYRGMYLLEVVKRGDVGLVSWLAVEYGPVREIRTEWYPSDRPQPFFDRTVDQFTVIAWAVQWYRQNWDALGPVREPQPER